MSRRKVWLFISIFVTFSTIVLLATGSSLLTMSLGTNQSIPFGTFITWVGLISLPLSIYWGIGELRKPTQKLNNLLAKFLRIILILAIFWLPISYLLAGNLSFSFSERETFQGGQIAMKCFWILSYGIGMGAVLTLAIYWLRLLVYRIRL